MKENTEKCQIRKTQDLSLSDYEAFLKKSKEQQRIDYPTSFRFIKISPVSDAQLLHIPKEDIAPLNCTRAQLINLSVQMIMENSFSAQKLDRKNLQALISQIAHNYNSISYHNFTHGFALMQMLYKCFKQDQNFGKIYSNQELTFYLLAGVTHDVNHKGTNNGYEVKLKTDLAKIAENDAVLQKMHLRTFFNITKSNPSFNEISKATNPQRTKYKITRAILATDMAKHFKNLQKIQKYRNDGQLNFNDEEIKIQYMQNLVHACDIGNGLLPTEQYLTWGALLTYQFNQQTKLQAQNNVPVTEFLKFKGINSFYDDQVGFLGTFVVPLWKQIAISFPGINTMLVNLNKNVQNIKELQEGQKK